uniref:BseYIB n=1 Tax=Bacillus sp. 2521 TaxID=925413 RepID=E5LGC3_9BACI|nr:BseYIB [Bacillus sp. 2521]
MVINHLLLPNLNINNEKAVPEVYKRILEGYLDYLNTALEYESIAMSEVVAGVISELILYNEIKHDWFLIIKDLLEYDELPISYSKNYGEKLYGFNSQWLQHTVHATYNHSFIMNLLNKSQFDYSSIILDLVQPDGYIYNKKVSATNPRTRMKSELLMSLAMGLSLIDSSRIPEQCIVKIKTFDKTEFVTAEYFKLFCLKLLKIDNLETYCNYNDILLERCFTGTGYADFNVQDKVDDYMGTLKRTARDKSVASPLITVYAGEIAEVLGSSTLDLYNSNKEKYIQHLSLNPLDITAYKMRDLNADFGESITPFEIFSTIILNN